MNEDCHVRVGEDGTAAVDFSGYDTVLTCPSGSQPGYYVDEADFSKGVACVRPEERATHAPGLRYLDGFTAEEEEGALPDWVTKIYSDHGFVDGRRRVE